MFRSHTPTVAVAAIVLMLAGCQTASSPSSEPGSEPPASVAPSQPEPSGGQATDTLASGTFTADLGTWGRAFEIDATGTGDDVSGTMEVSSAKGKWSVDLQCSRTADNGLLVIAGQVTESTHEIFSEGAYVGILLAPGTPVRTILWLEDEASPADSCTAFLDTMFSDPGFPGPVEDLFPIQGDLELGS
jgi:hypothetical protein